MNSEKSFGKFITLEGVEGVGKTTNIDLLKKILTEKNINFITTREPGGTAIAEDIRQILLTKKTEKLQPISELLLMFAARAQHIHEVIQPALKAGQWVLCDRFTDATYAYQGGGRQIDLDKIATLESWVQNQLKPDLTFLLDLSVEEGLKRAAKRSEKDRFEIEQISFFQAVRSVYLDRAKAMPNRFIVIDASQSIAEVNAQIQAHFEQFIHRQISK